MYVREREHMQQLLLEQAQLNMLLKQRLTETETKLSIAYEKITELEARRKELGFGDELIIRHRSKDEMNVANELEVETGLKPGVVFKN